MEVGTVRWKMEGIGDVVGEAVGDAYLWCDEIFNGVGRRLLVGR